MSSDGCFLINLAVSFHSFSSAHAGGWKLPGTLAFLKQTGGI
jgi:hypothetical protein